MCNYSANVNIMFTHPTQIDDLCQNLCLCKYNGKSFEGHDRSSIYCVQQL